MEKIILGKEITFRRSFTDKDIIDFSQTSQDENPIHLDEAHAAKSIFGQRVVHGVLIISMISKILGTIYPGEGAIYLSQTAKFIKPAFIGEEITAKATQISYDNDSKKGVYLTECFKDGDTLILTGEAKVLFPKRFEL
ncbi:MAG: MaoC family dehydratase [Bacteroidota bacterium]